MSAEYAPGPASTAPSGPQVLLVTDDESLHEDVALIAAVAAVRLQRCTSWAGVPDAEYAVVMCGADALPPQGRASGPVLLIGSVVGAGPEAGAGSAEGPAAGPPEQTRAQATALTSVQDLWSLASQYTELWPVPLPAAEAWLSEHIGARVSDVAAGTTIAVSGAIGGAGASTVGYLLAAALASRSIPVALIDADAAWGSGLSGLLGEPSQNGAGQGWLSWEEVSGLGEEIAAAQLAASLPRVDGVHVLTRKSAGSAVISPSGDRPGSSWAETVVAAVRAAGRAFDVVVIDVGRRHDVLRALAETLDQHVIVTPGSPRGVLCAREVLAMSADVPASAMVNAGSSADWGAGEVSRALGGVSVLAELPRQRWLSGAGRISEVYDIMRTRRGARIVDDLVQGLGGVLETPARREPLLWRGAFDGSVPAGGPSSSVGAGKASVGREEAA